MAASLIGFDPAPIAKDPITFIDFIDFNRSRFEPLLNINVDKDSS